jgi:hypothetical protein
MAAHIAKQIGLVITEVNVAIVDDRARGCPRGVERDRPSSCSRR